MRKWVWLLRVGGRDLKNQGGKILQIERSKVAGVQIFLEIQQTLVL